jgi:hypothetical protein
MLNKNKYDDGKSNFLSPKVTQHDGHMVMTNVTKPSKHKFINIDTRYRDDYSSPTSTQYDITLPERITDVKSIMVRNIEIPITTYNFSEAIGNTYFQITDASNTTNKVMVKIKDGDYTPENLTAEVNEKIQLTGFTNLLYKTSTSLNSISSFDCSSGTLIVDFAVNVNGQADVYNTKRKLGWFLGFRKTSYTVKTGTETNPSITTSEAFVDYSGLRYLYLIVDEYTSGNQNSFIAALSSSLVRKNILARISMNKSMFTFGTCIPANIFNGYLLSDRRIYSGKVDIQKLRVQLVDDVGNPVSLNGLDYSFCLEVEHE